MGQSDDTMVVLTSGKQDRGTRATLAFSWACSALAMGMRTSVFMTMEGTIWAMRNAARGVQVDGFEPIESYIETFLSLGGSLLVCAPCTTYYCSTDDVERVASTLIEGAELVGLATVVSRTGPGCRILTL
ncbi:MAG: DsrE family protein [Planctomycetes bacterium]|nr:DsrE family protein [Planctomycetota bacterium]